MTAHSLSSSRRAILRTAGGIAAGAVIGGLSLLNSNRARASGPVTIRPILDFLNAQGKSCVPNPYGLPGCYLYVPPAPNFLGFSTRSAGESTGLFGAFDYAGLANKTFDNAFGTTIGANSMVTEQPLDNGTALVRVLLYTEHANAWVIRMTGSPLLTDLTAQQYATEVANYPTLFGLRPQDAAVNLSGAAFGNSFFDIVFINTAPGAPLVDLISLAPPALQFIAFRAQAKGPLTAAFGVPDGTPGLCAVSESGLIATSAVANPKSRVALDAFPAELVDLHVVGG